MISIIIPFYNREKTLKKCLKSAIKQTFKDIQILLVDDGSTDKSLSICEKLRKKDGRIKIVHYEPNRGVAFARNTSLKHIDGEYFIFLDSDDWLPKRALELLYNEMAKSNSDYVVGSMKVIEPIHSTSDNTLDFSFSLKNPMYCFFLERKYYIHSAKKILKTSIVKENNISFKEGVDCGEDAIFMLDYLGFCKRISSISNVVYYNNRLIDNTNGVGRYYPFKHVWARQQLIAYQNCLDNYTFDENTKMKLMTLTSLHMLISISEHHMMFAKDSDSKTNKIIETLSEIGEFINYCELKSFAGVKETEQYNALVDIANKKRTIDSYLYLFSYKQRGSFFKTTVKKIISHLKFFFLYF